MLSKRQCAQGSFNFLVKHRIPAGGWLLLTFFFTIATEYYFHVVQDVYSFVENYLYEKVYDKENTHCDSNGGIRYAIIQRCIYAFME